MADVIEPGGDGAPSIVPAGVVRDRAFYENVAAGAVRAYCGWHVTPIVDEKFILDARGGPMLAPPSGRILSVLSCEVSGVDVTDDVAASVTSGMVEFKGRRCWPVGLGSVVLTVRHGYSPGEASDVVGVVAALADRLAAGDRVKRQSVGGASVEFEVGAESMFARELASLEPYRLRWVS